MADPNFERVPVLCPKCQSPRMVIQDIYEMWESKQPKNAMPNFRGSFKKRVLCAEIECGVEVWPVKWVVKEPANPVTGTDKGEVK